MFLSVRHIPPALLVIGLAVPVYAEPTLERIALQLTGDTCPAQYPRLHKVLAEVEGVRAVDFASIPDHALLDVDLRLLSTHELAAIFERTLAHTGCRAEPMESCISAGPAGHSTNRPHPAEGQAQPH